MVACRCTIWMQMEEFPQVGRKMSTAESQMKYDEVIQTYTVGGCSRVIGMPCCCFLSVAGTELR